MRHTSRRLTMVKNRPASEHDPKELDPKVAQRLEDFLWAGPPIGGIEPEPPDDPLPFVVRLTITQILEVAADVEIRAEMLDEVTSTLDAGSDGPFASRVAGLDQIERRADSLRDVTRDLRTIVAGLIKQWTEEEGSS